MKLLCLTDPTTHPENDTTNELYNKFAERPEIEFFHGPTLAVNDTGQLPTCLVEARMDYADFLALDSKAQQKQHLRDFDLVFNRADKPFPPNYLEHLAKFEQEALFVNRPSKVVTAGRKSFIAEVAADLLPAHIFSRDKDQIAAFFDKHGCIVAKQNFSYGGKGVYKIWESDGKFQLDNAVIGKQEFRSLNEALDFLFERDEEEYEFVTFLENTGEGDNRVLVTEGEVVGNYLRRSQGDGWVHNTTLGGSYTDEGVSEREHEVVAKTCHAYHEIGIYTLGYDFLMGANGERVLSEINAGNVGGYNFAEEVCKKPVMDGLIDWLVGFAARH